MSHFLGRHNSLLLFSNETHSVVIDETVGLVVEIGETPALIASADWILSEETYEEQSIVELAEVALSRVKIDSLTASARLYTIPAGVKAEAKKALEWRKEEKRGGTPVGLNTARTLARGGQIGIEKIRHIAKYFPRHEVDKKGKGWRPGEDNFPSNGRIAWALWGGDAGWRWAKAIVEREDKKSLRADAYPVPELEDFKISYEIDESVAPEFMARVRLDGSGIDRIYKVDIDGHVFAWDDGAWDDLGHADGDIWTYDRALDDAYDTVPKEHILIDAESALIICAKLQAKPFDNVSILDIDEEEAIMAAAAVYEEDWDFIDYAVTAAGEDPIGSTVQNPNVPADGTPGYTSADRSKNASKQVRDARGLFAAQGTKVSVVGKPNGVITGINAANKTVTVKHDDGSVSTVPATDTRRVESIAEVRGQSETFDPDPNEIAPMDTRGILGEPRTPINQPKAHLPGTLPPLTRNDLSSILANYPAWVASERNILKPLGTGTGTSTSNTGVSTSPASAPTSTSVGPKPGQTYYNPKTPYDTAPRSRLDTGETGKFLENLTGIKQKPGDYDAYKHPLLKDWLNKTVKRDGKTYTPNALWYQPITSAAEAEVAEAVKEKKTEEQPVGQKKVSDVQPLYLAIVAPDDPRAVLDLVSIVPAGASSTQPMTYVRKDKRWVRDAKYLDDLRSATPPPVVPMDSETLNDVLTQIDSLVASAYSQTLMVLFGPNPVVMDAYEKDFLEELFPDFESLLAAGGLDRNRGGAEALRRYWTVGKGAAKIRWGTPGDWKRCVRYLGKYLGVRAKGYCQLRHKEATGVYTGSRLNPGNENSSEEFLMEEVWGKNIGEPTKITDEDMLMPLPEIMDEKDDIYDHHWEPEEDIVLELKALNDFSDEEFEVLVAGARPPSGFNIDRNRRNADKLRRYWTKGKGAAKIRWNTGGDWTRCVRYLSKYIGPRARGYCALRHKEVTGLWTGDKAHLKMYGGRTRGGRNVFSNEVINSEEKVLELVNLQATANALKERVGITASAGEVGSKFVIPLVIPEDHESGDGRKFKKGAISWRELPLPLMWQIQTADGHQGSVVVGRIDSMERTEDGIGNCYGVFDTGAHAKEVERLIRNGFVRGVSADMDQFEATEHNEKEDDDSASKNSKSVGKGKIIIDKARIMGVTIVAKPAFQECKILLSKEAEDYTDNQQEDTVIPQDGIYADDADFSDAESLVACGFVAGAIPVTPPANWFKNPKLTKATPLTVDDTGRVYGHIASWDTNHIGMAYGTRPPRSKSGYAYFHTGVVRTEEGTDIPVGQLTLAGGHASLEASAMEAVKHYDDTASSVADVHAGEDAYGIWVAGALRPGTQPEQIRALRASAPSGDWRPIRGSLELVAVCQVNVPGFPIARARVASGAVMALVAAGAASLAKMKSDPVNELADRLNAIEQMVSGQKNEELASKVAELSARIRSEEQFQYDDEFAFISRKTREKLAEEGKALPDGSYPIRNVADLKNAIQAYGRAKNKSAARKHIEKRARALKKGDLIPEEWSTASVEEEAMVSSADDLRARIASAQDRLGKALAVEAPKQDDEFIPYTDEQGEVLPEVVDGVPQNAPTVESGSRAKGVYTPQTQPRDEAGKFRKVLARLKNDLGTAGLQGIVEEAKAIDKLHELGNYAEAAGASVKLLDIVDRLDAGALNKVSLENVRSSAAELGKVIANLPLGFNNQNEKVRYSDLPPALRDLMDSMIERVETKIGKKDADVATQALKSFKSGSDVFSQGEISSEMSKLLRLLT